MAPNEPQYPVQFSVDYPDRPLNRFSSFFRLVAVIPIGIVLAAISGGQSGISGSSTSFGWVALVLAFVSAPGLMIFYRQKYPRWWFDWYLALLRFENRVTAFLLLMRDEYPSTDEEQSVHLEIPYPNVETDLNRWLLLVKWLLVIPHYIVLLFLGIGVFVAVVVSWFAILFTGRYPRELFYFVEGWLRWTNRVNAYAFILVTDRYPPFRLSS